MVLKEEESPIWKYHQAQILPVCPWGNPTMGDKLLVDLLSCSQLGVCHIQDFPEHS